MLIFTEQFGIQSYIVNGVRAERKGGTKAGMFQPAAILDMVVYHHDQKNLQRIKEFRWSYLYRQVYTDMVRTTLVLYMMELLQKCLRQPETNPELYAFVEGALMGVDIAGESAAANEALHFSLALAGYLGFRLGGRFSPGTPVLDLVEGSFVATVPTHVHYLSGYLSECAYLLLEASTVDQLGAIRLNRDLRRELLQAFQTFYALHVPDFGQLRSLPVLQEILKGAS